ncbi:MAG TPA: DUF2484 family protein [Aliiroseovarius sp.]|nr:DUF2484 family protein [Aliiroseovarius sp.]
MSLPFVLVCLWVVLAALLSALPSRDNHWRHAYFLTAIGIPLLGYVTWESGPLWGMVALFTGALVLRWPLYAVWRWVRRQMAG